MIIDEASAMKKDAFRMINEYYQKIMGNNKLFGGITVVLGGDFRQTLPVVCASMY